VSNFSILIKNIASLYGLTIAQMVLPLIILPYMTRVLSLNAYGLIAYVSTIMGYMQLLVNFGFMLSGTKDVVNSKNDIVNLGKVVGDIMVARIINAFFALGILAILIYTIPVLRSNPVFVAFSYCSIFMSIFLFDYLFRGLEQMQVITYRFLLMRVITIALTFIFVKGDSDIMWIPGLTLFGDCIAVSFTYYEIRKRGIRISYTSIANAAVKLKESAIYFLSDAAATIFGSINTILIGIFLPLSDVAIWALVVKIVTVIQSMYNPIITGLYPRMVEEKSWQLLNRMSYIFMPIVVIGSVFTYYISDYAIVLIAGEKYLPSAQLLRWLIPWILFPFPAMLYGWPALGSIGKVKQITCTTVGSAIFQVLGLVIFAVTGNFTLFTVAIIRDVTEIILFVSRFSLCLKYRREFND